VKLFEPLVFCVVGSSAVLTYLTYAPRGLLPTPQNPARQKAFMVDVLDYTIGGITLAAYLWGIWLLLPFVQVQEGDGNKPYFRRRVKTCPDQYVPRWYLFPFFLNVTVIAAVVWLILWAVGKLVLYALD
jgi:hypothetical protein